MHYVLNININLLLELNLSFSFTNWLIATHELPLWRRSALQEFWPLSTHREMLVDLKKNVGTTSAFCVDTLRGWNPIVFSFTHVVEVKLAELPAPNKIVGQKIHFRPRKKSWQKGHFSHEHHHVDKNRLWSHLFRGRNWFSQWKDFCWQKENFPSC